MKLNILKYLVLPLVVASLAFVSCEYDDTELKGRLDKVESDIADLNARVDAINGEIDNLKNLIKAVQERDHVTGVTETGNGYTIEFSKSPAVTITNSAANYGYGPVISVKQDEDGEYYWTVDGEFVLDGTEKVPANRERPEVKVEDGMFCLYLNGTKVKELGDTGNAGIFKSVTEDVEAGKVIIELLDGTVIEIPKAKPFAIVIDEGLHDIVIFPGESGFFSFQIESEDENVDIIGLATDGYKVTVNQYGLSGDAEVLPPDPMVDGKIILIASNKTTGATVSKIMAIEEGVFNIKDDSQLLQPVPAKGGEISLTLETNINYDEIRPVDPSVFWIKQKPATKAVHTDIITLLIEENTGTEPRSAEIVLQAHGPIEPKKFTIYQNEPRPGDGEEDFSTLNDGNTTGIRGNYFTKTGWSLNEGKVESGSRFNQIVVPGLSRLGTMTAEGVVFSYSSLTSPELQTGIGTLYFKYAKTAIGTKAIMFRVEILNESGEIVKTEHITTTSAKQFVVYNKNINFNHKGVFKIRFVAEAAHNDNFVIYDVYWTGPATN